MSAAKRKEKKMKIAINECYGGFSLSKEAYKELGLAWDDYGFAYREHEKRADPKLIEVIEKLGKKASGECAELAVVEVPNDVDWQIEEYDGSEWIAEKHRTWR